MTLRAKTPLFAYDAGQHLCWHTNNREGDGWRWLDNVFELLIKQLKFPKYLRYHGVLG